MPVRGGDDPVEGGASEGGDVADRTLGPLQYGRKKTDASVSERGTGVQTPGGCPCR